MDSAVEHGADDVEEVEDTLAVSCEPKIFAELRQALEGFGVLPQVEVLTYVAKDFVTVTAAQAMTITKIVDHLEDLDDVQEIYHNVSLS